jgi:hypothetical protein
MSVAVVTDSAGSLPPTAAERLSIGVVLHAQRTTVRHDGQIGDTPAESLALSTGHELRGEPG